MLHSTAPTPTPYAEVNRLLLALLGEVQMILGEQLVGFYLYGSLSSGDFDPQSSDVDFLIVTADVLEQDVLEALRQMHARIAASDLPYARKLEGSYIPRQALRRYDPANATHPTMDNDWEFGLGQHGANWILERFIVREQGVVVYGPAPKTLIDPVSPADLRGAVCEMLSDFWQAQLSGPDWLRPRDYQAFAILSLCRALYTLSEGKVASKPQAAAWARQALDPHWQPLIDQALLWRHQHETADLTQMLAFLRFALARALEICPQE